MIEKFSFSNYGPVNEKVTLSFVPTKSTDLEEYYIASPAPGIRLLRLALIYGPNASGKTTILDALRFLRKISLQMPEDKNQPIDINQFKLRKNDNTTTFTISFYHKKIKFLYELKVTPQAVTYEVLYFYQPRKALLFERKTNISEKLAEIRFGSKVKIPKKDLEVLSGNTLWNSTVLAGYLRSNINIELMEIATDWLKKQLAQWITPRTLLGGFILQQIEDKKIDKDLLVSLLRKADLGITDLEIKKEPLPEDLKKLIRQVIQEENKKDLEREIEKLPVRKVIFRHSIKNRVFELNLNLESAGTRRYFEMAGILLYILKGKKVLPVDELEASLHSDLVEHFLVTFLGNPTQSQLIATTHFRELLQNKDIIRPDAIWFCEKNDTGATELFSLTDFDSRKLRKQAHSFYNAYKIGKLGAVPNLDNDITLDLDNE